MEGFEFEIPFLRGKEEKKSQQRRCLFNRCAVLARHGSPAFSVALQIKVSVNTVSNAESLRTQISYGSRISLAGSAG